MIAEEREIDDRDLIARGRGFSNTHTKRERGKGSKWLARALVIAAVLLIEDECLMCLTAYLKEFSMFYGGVGFMSDHARSCCYKSVIVKMDA